MQKLRKKWTEEIAAPEVGGVHLRVEQQTTRPRR